MLEALPRSQWPLVLHCGSHRTMQRPKSAQRSKSESAVQRPMQRVQLKPAQANCVHLRLDSKALTQLRSATKQDCPATSTQSIPTHTNCKQVAMRAVLHQELRVCARSSPQQDTQMQFRLQHLSVEVRFLNPKEIDQPLQE